MNDKEKQYFREKICMTKEKYKENPHAFLKKSIFCQILRKKICILPNSKGKKSVYTDKISMSGRSVFSTTRTSQYLNGMERQGTLE